MTNIRITLENDDKIDLTLYEEYAPLTVANFLHLVDTEFYKGTIFHRIIKGFMSQGGGYYLTPEAELLAKSVNYTIPGEFTANGWANAIKHKAGVISMARTSDMNSANTQFFICDADCASLDNNYAAFGVVADDESFKVLTKLASTETKALCMGFENFPVTATENITIRSIERI